MKHMTGLGHCKLEQQISESIAMKHLPPTSSIVSLLKRRLDAPSDGIPEEIEELMDRLARIRVHGIRRHEGRVIMSHRMARTDANAGNPNQNQVQKSRW